MAVTPAPPSAVAPQKLRLVPHAQYTSWEQTWKYLRDAYEGTGGFADGMYLVAHPREWLDYTHDAPSKPTKKLKARRNLARYENVAELIVSAVKSALFRQVPTRQVRPDDPKDQRDPTAIEDWWDDVDGLGSHIDDWIAETWVGAAVYGHVLCVMDRPTGPAVTLADQPRPYLRAYTPLDMADWVYVDGKLREVRLSESVPRLSLSAVTTTDLQYRILTEAYWALYDRKGGLVTADEHGMGVLPAVVLYAKRRTLTGLVGSSTLKDPKLHIDLYNLTSELRELLRSQTFSLLNVPLGTGPDAISVETARAMMGDTIGVDNVLFSALPAQFVTADAANVAAYQAEIDRLLRRIYRVAGITWESDSRDAEAADSLRLKRDDMNRMLSGYADECERAEYALAERFYRLTFGDRWEQEWERDQVTIRYPESFDVEPFQELLDQALAAQSFSYPASFWAELMGRMLDRFLPDLPLSKKAEMLADIAASAEKKDLQADQLRARLASAAGWFGAAKPDERQEQGGDDAQQP